MTIHNILHKDKQQGLSMVELGLIFVVIAVAIAGIFYAYSSVMTADKEQELVKQIQEIAAAENQYLAEQSFQEQPVGLSQLYTQKYSSTKPYKLAQDDYWHNDLAYNAFGQDIEIITGAEDGAKGFKIDPDNNLLFRIQDYFPTEEICERVRGMLKANGKLFSTMSNCHVARGHYNLCIQFNSDIPVQDGSCQAGQLITG
ncbi:type II secretion system protein [Fangia hongkongensis]|uniref:type II secretion system protein n=1 Tax=Fangia hongkongensis TaxID=270495 RepID=UPI00037DF95D|nr:type II secretion system protein [Fangia hongkongensis]MBK2124004.1 type II secretion system protein [Fangia hongkongensis]